VKNEEKIKEELEAPLEEIRDLSRPDFRYDPPPNHDWRQQGYYLVCHSCEIQHAVWIGPEKIMVGIDEKGAPILKTRRELKMA